MKVIIISILLVTTTQLAAGELTEKDFQKIGNLLDKQERRIKEYVDLKFGAVKAEIEAIKWFITALIVIIVALIGIPQAVQLWRERKESREIDMLNREVERVSRSNERLEREIEELKKRKFYVES